MLSSDTGARHTVDGPEIAGLHRFNRSVRPVTYACGAHEYALDYASQARERIAAAATQRLGASVKTARVSISDVEIQTRCFFVGDSSTVHCNSDVTVTLQAVWTAGARTRSGDAREQGAGKVSAGAFCAEGGRSVAIAADAALERALTAALAAAP